MDEQPGADGRPAPGAEDDKELDADEKKWREDADLFGLVDDPEVRGAAPPPGKGAGKKGRGKKGRGG